MASVGQWRTQVVQPMHLSGESSTECSYVFIANLPNSVVGMCYARFTFMVMVVPTPTVDWMSI